MQKIPNAKKFTLILSTRSMEVISDKFAHTGISRSLVVRALIDRFAERLEDRRPGAGPITQEAEALVNEVPIDGRILAK